MDCPSCKNSKLEEKDLAPGQTFDVCPECDGVWFEAGELESLGAKAPGFDKVLGHAAKSLQPTQRACPACRALLSRAWIDPAQVEPMYCPDCKGYWFAAAALKSLRAYFTRQAAVSPEAEPAPSAAPLGGLSVNWPVVGVVAAGALFVIYQLRSPAPRSASAVARAEPARPAPEPAASPAAAPAVIPRGPSEAELRAMVQAEVKGALKPAAKLEASSEVDSPAYSLPADASRVAVVVGVERYSSLPSADFAARDAQAMRDHLEALGFPPRNILLLTDGAATKGKLMAALNSWLPKHADKNSTVFFYYSGHGAPDVSTSQAYLVPADGEAEDLADTALPLKQVYAKLGGLRARHVVVALDSCFSGIGERSVIPKGTRPLMTKVDPKEAAPDSITVLSASSPDQASGSLPMEGHGVFTYFLLRGLNGDAADDRGSVTVSSLFRYLKPQVEDQSRQQRRDQTPQMAAGTGDTLVLR